MSTIKKHNKAMSNTLHTKKAEREYYSLAYLASKLKENGVDMTAVDLSAWFQAHGFLTSSGLATESCKASGLLEVIEVIEEIDEDSSSFTSLCMPLVAGELSVKRLVELISTDLKK